MFVKATEADTFSAEASHASSHGDHQKLMARNFSVLKSVVRSEEAARELDL
jgi:hypothetical protein